MQAPTTSGSPQFDQLRTALAKDKALRSEVENALRLNVDRVNPTDRGNRFIVGAAVEWIVAAAAWSAGILTLPGGHNANGFDLVDLQVAARGLWSVKSQSAKRRTAFRISNGLGGGGAGLVDPVVFVAPGLKGLVFVDPATHTHVTRQQVLGKDAVTLPFAAVEMHAFGLPACLAPLTVPTNEGHGRENPALDYTETILTPGQFPRLSRMFVAAKPQQKSLADEVQRLAAMRDAGTIDDDTFRALVKALT